MALDQAAIKTAAKVLIEASFNTEFGTATPPSTTATIKAAVARVIAEVVDEFADAIDAEISGIGSANGFDGSFSGTAQTVGAATSYIDLLTPATNGTWSLFIYAQASNSADFDNSTWDHVAAVRRNGGTLAVRSQASSPEVTPAAMGAATISVVVDSGTSTKFQLGCTGIAALTINWKIRGDYIVQT